MFPGPHYTEAEYDFLREIALKLKEFHMVWSTSERAKDLKTVMDDLDDFVREDLDEY